MSTERHIAKREEMLPELISFFMGLAAILFVRGWIMRVQSVLWKGVIIVGLVAALFAIHRLIRFLYGNGRAVLTEKGIQVGGYLGRGKISWGNLIQVGAFTLDGCKVLTLLVKGGKPFSPTDKKTLFYLKNSSRLVLLRDTKKARAFVEEHYGPLDFDLSTEKDEK